MKGMVLSCQALQRQKHNMINDDNRDKSDGWCEHYLLECLVVHWVGPT